MKKRATYTKLQTIINIPNPSYTEPASDSIAHHKIKFRRNHVNKLRLRGYSNEAISKTTGYSLSTIEKDMHEINELSREWYAEQAVKDFHQSLYDSIIRYDNAIEELQILYTEHDDLDSKLKIQSKIAEFEEKKQELYSKTRSVRNYLQEKKHYQ